MVEEFCCEGLSELREVWRESMNFISPISLPDGKEFCLFLDKLLYFSHFSDPLQTHHNLEGDFFWVCTEISDKLFDIFSGDLYALS
jgi:hypothetical protein